MATKTGPDLSFAEVAIERLMDDTCAITRDVGGTASGTLDRNTGKIVDTSVALVYGDGLSGGTGKCSLASTTISSLQFREEGGESIADTSYTLSLPLSFLRLHPECEPAEGDVVQMTTSRRDPAEVGRGFKVGKVLTRTMSVSRKLILQAMPAGAPLPLPPYDVSVAPPTVQGEVGIEIVFASSNTWIAAVPSTFGRTPAVTLYVDGEEVEAPIVADSTLVTVQWPFPVAGRMVLT